VRKEEATLKPVDRAKKPGNKKRNETRAIRDTRYKILDVNVATLDAGCPKAVPSNPIPSCNILVLPLWD